MQYAMIEITGNQALVRESIPITCGTVGGTVDIRFDEGWEGFAKTLVWRGSKKTVCDTGCTGIIPAQVLTQPGRSLYVGVYGTRDGTATPTLWADLGVIQPGADPAGDESTDPTLPMWAALKETMGNVEQALDAILLIQEGLL